MKKIKKVFLGIGTLWTTMIANVYAFTGIQTNFIEAGLYGPPRVEKKYIEPMQLIGIIAIIVGLNVILRKKFKEKKNVLNIILIISSVVVTILIIFLMVSLFN